MKHRSRTLLLILWLASLLPAVAFPIEPAGIRWAEKLDAMDVEHHWIAGEPIFWKTGDLNPKSRQEASHCSAFVAAACERADIYILRPPEHGQTFLANAQQEWLETTGISQGWQRVSTPEEAQRLANRGLVVVASYRNPDPHRAGHIAIVRPSEKSIEAIQSDGPQITQAGTRNYASTSVRVGFSHHKGAFANGEIRYFVRKMD